MSQFQPGSRGAKAEAALAVVVAFCVLVLAQKIAQTVAGHLLAGAFNHAFPPEPEPAPAEQNGTPLDGANEGGAEA